MRSFVPDLCTPFIRVAICLLRLLFIESTVIPYPKNRSERLSYNPYLQGKVAANMDKPSPMKRMASVRKSAAFACHVRRKSGQLMASRKSSYGTESVMRRSIIELFSHTEDVMDSAAHELAEAMDSAFYSPPELSSENGVTFRIPDYTTGHSSKSVTIMPQDHESQPLSPRKRRRGFHVMEKLQKHRPQLSLPSPIRRKPSVDGDISIMKRSKTVVARWSKALLRKRKSDDPPPERPQFHRKSSSVSETLSIFSATIKQTLAPRRSGEGNIYSDAPNLSTPMLDAEVTTYEQIITAKHDIGRPKIDSAQCPPPEICVEQDFTPFRDSAYYSKASGETNTRPTITPSSSYTSAILNKENTQISTSKLPASVYSPSISSPRTPKHDRASHRPSTSHSNATQYFSARSHAQSTPTAIRSQGKTIRSAKSTPDLSPRRRPQNNRPRFDRFLSTTSILSVPSLSACSPTTSKPPSPLTQRPFLDMQKAHKRTFSSGSTTASIRIFLDEEEEQELERKESQKTNIKVDKVRPRPQKDTRTVDQRALDAQRTLHSAVMAEGKFHLSTPLFRTAVLTNPAAKSQCPLTLATLTLPATRYRQRIPIHQHPSFPDVPYAPHASAPGHKWYDECATAQSRQYIWEGEYVRGKGYDPELRKLFEGINWSQSDVARRVLRGGVEAEDGSCRSPTDDMVEMRKYRFRGVDASIEGVMEGLRTP